MQSKSNLLKTKKCKQQAFIEIKKNKKFISIPLIFKAAHSSLGVHCKSEKKALRMPHRKSEEWTEKKTNRRKQISLIKNYM